MLRIEMTDSEIVIELVARKIGDNKPNRRRTYPNTPESRAALLSTVQARRARYLSVDQYPPRHEGDRELFITYNQARHYKIVDGVWYDARMKEGLIRLLAQARGASLRLKLYHGDPVTGRAWGVDEAHPLGDAECGYVGRTGGSIKEPILVHNRRSMGGGIISKAIIRVEVANKKDSAYPGGVLYDLTGEYPDAPYNRATLKNVYHLEYV